MNSTSERKKNIYLSIGLILFALCVTGATYAYFALTASNNSLTGTVGGATLTLTVNKIVPTTQSTNMIPQLESTLGDAISSNYNCVDDHNNVICHVYKATITNGNQATSNLKGTISFELVNPQEGETLATNFPNLRWKRITNATTLGTENSNSALTEGVFEEGKVFNPGASQEYYFVVWVNETGEEQSDHGVFRVNINFKSAEGDGLTSTVRPEAVANSPNIDNGNLIPVYYDNSSEVWRKADSSNVNNSWYDYDNKEWANAVLIKDDTIRTTYKNIAVDEEVPESVIDAFYVWIPRYKYRVWNITRQAPQYDEANYSYPAYSEGIDIEWEIGTESTGNVECSYNELTEESETNLSDVCVYKGIDTITTTSGNSNYTDAWYTHPAFDFGGVSKTGFWIGKFETSGEAANPQIVPDATSLISQEISARFTTSKLFQTYGLSNNVDAHMLTNLEWGAVTYLTYSIYGLCNETSCRDVYINNSGDYYTGRSGGYLAGDENLILKIFYGSDVTTSYYSYNDYGYYNYKGYMLDINGIVTSTKDVSRVASTTGNVTGVYDMSGGSVDLVMGNMVDETGAFYLSYSGDLEISWNGTSTLDSKYYNSYSYGVDDTHQSALNRSRLGDATAEVTTNAIYNYSVWYPGVDFAGVYNDFVNGSDSWFLRGGYHNIQINNSGEGTGMFFYHNTHDFLASDISSRSAIS